MRLRIDFWGLCGFVRRKDDSFTVVFVNYPEVPHRPRLLTSVRFIDYGASAAWDDQVANGDDQLGIWNLENTEIEVLDDRNRPATGAVAADRTALSGCPTQANIQSLGWVANLTRITGSRAKAALLNSSPPRDLAIGRCWLRAGRLYSSQMARDNQGQILKFEVDGAQQAMAECITYEVEADAAEFRLKLAASKTIVFRNGIEAVQLTVSHLPDPRHATGHGGSHGESQVRSNGGSHFLRFYDLLDPVPATRKDSQEVDLCISTDLKASPIGGWPVRCPIAQLEE